MPVRHEPGFKEALSTMQRLKRAEDKKKQEATAQPSSSSSSWHWHPTTSTHLKNGMTTKDNTGKPVFWVVHYWFVDRASTYRRIWIFLFGYHEIGNRWRQSTFTDGGCRGIISYTSYSRTNDCVYNGYVNINLEPNAMNNIDTVAHMNMHYTQYWAHWALFIDAQLCHIAPVAQDRLARVIPSMHVHLCVLSWLFSLHPSPSSTLFRCSPSGPSRCLPQSSTRGSSPKTCATSAWGPWPLLTTRHPSQTPNTIFFPVIFGSFDYIIRLFSNYFGNHPPW